MQSEFKSEIFDLNIFKNLSRPSNFDLKIGGCHLYFMRTYLDVRGRLSVGEYPYEIPFKPKRFFLIHDVPSYENRGEHAHKICKQFLICVRGSCKVLIDDGIRQCRLLLNASDIGLFVPEMNWGCQYEYSEDAILLVFASALYDTEEYIRNYDEFKKIKNS